MHRNDTDTDTLIEADTDQTKASCVQTRFVIAVTAFIGLAITLGQRASFSVALVAMVNFTDVDKHVNQTRDECPEITRHGNSTAPDWMKEGDFDWDGDVQSNLLASFFYGYVSLQFLGGYLGERYSLKLMMTLSVLIPSLLNMLVPLLADHSITALMVARVIAGLFTGPIFPCNAAIWGRWAPVMERTSLAAISAMGGNFGVMVGTPIAGLLCDTNFLGGWPSVFYIYGICGLLWCALWLFIMYDTPAKHPRISTAEKEHIEESLKNSNTEKYVSVPWCSILTSRPVWVMNFSFLCDGIGFYVVFSCFPLYLREVLKYDVQWNGIILSLIYLASITATLVSGILADFLRRKTSLSVTFIRKLFTLLGHGGAALFCLGVAFVNCKRILAVVFMIATLGMEGLSSSGFGVNPIDLAPRYSGTIMGISNGFGNVGGILAPVFVNFITHGSASKSDWQTVFFMTSGIFGISSLVYALLSSSSEQIWAHPISRPRNHRDELNIQEEQQGVQT